MHHHVHISAYSKKLCLKALEKAFLEYRTIWSNTHVTFRSIDLQ